MGVMRDNIAGPNNIDREMALKWFPFIGALFLFILYSNILGYLPLPVNSGETFDLFGAQHPGLPDIRRDRQHLGHARPGADGVDQLPRRRHPPQGPVHYLKSWLPAGMDKVPARAFMVPFVFSIEVISQFVRIISLSVRLFANMLAGHLLDPVHGWRLGRARRGRGAWSA